MRPLHVIYRSFGIVVRPLTAKMYHERHAAQTRTISVLWQIVPQVYVIVAGSQSALLYPLCSISPDPAFGPLLIMHMVEHNVVSHPLQPLFCYTRYSHSGYEHG